MMPERRPYSPRRHQYEGPKRVVEHKGVVLQDGVRISLEACAQMGYAVNQIPSRRCHVSSTRNSSPKGTERFNVRLAAPLKSRLTEAATKAGFATVSAYVRHILMREADGQSTEQQIDDMEQKTVATINRLSREVHQLRVQHLATWSLVDSLTKAFFTCVPEPPPQMTEQATANAKRRYDRLLLTVAQTMRAQGPAVLKELERNAGT
jgi:hypothetical protein